MAPLLDYASRAFSGAGIQPTACPPAPYEQKTLKLLFCEIMGKLSGPSAQVGVCVYVYVCAYACVQGGTRMCVKRGMLSVSKWGVDLYLLPLVTEQLSGISKFS